MNCPLNIECNPTCPYKKEGLCDYPYIGAERSPIVEEVSDKEEKWIVEQGHR